MGKNDGRYYAPSEYEKYKNSLRARQDYSEEEEYSIHTDEHFYRQIQAENNRHIQRQENAVSGIPQPPVNTVNKGREVKKIEYGSVYDRIAQKKKNSPKDSWYDAGLISEFSMEDDSGIKHRDLFSASYHRTSKTIPNRKIDEHIEPLDSYAEQVDTYDRQVNTYDGQINVNAEKVDIYNERVVALGAQADTYDDYDFLDELPTDENHQQFGGYQNAVNSVRVDKKAYNNTPLTEDETQSFIDRISQAMNFDEESAEQEFYTKEDIVGMCEYYRKKYSRKMWITLISSLSFFCVILAIMYLYMNGYFDIWFL